MTANIDTKKFKVVYRCLDKENKLCYVTVDCFGPNIPESTIDNEKMLIDISKDEFERLNVTPLGVEGLDYDAN